MSDRTYLANLVNDSRVTDICSVHKGDYNKGSRMISILIEDEQGGEHLALFPADLEVCYTCEGKGTHVNPRIDAGGLTREDFYDDPEFRDEYRAGFYDVVCNTCKGDRKLPEIIPPGTDDNPGERDEDWTPIRRHLYKLYCEHREADAYWESVSRAERAMGA